MSILDPMMAGDAVMWHTLTEYRPWWKLWQLRKPLRQWQIGICLRCMAQFDEHGNRVLTKKSRLHQRWRWNLCHHMQGGLGDGGL